MTATALRPLGIGEIPDSGIELYRADAATLVEFVVVSCRVVSWRR